MSCNLCHESGEHKKTCPTLIRVEWESSASVWESLARVLFDEFVSASYAALTDRGSSEDERKLDGFVRHCKQALDDGDAYTVVELFRNGRG